MNSSNQDNNSYLERKQSSEDVSSEHVTSDKKNNSDSDDLPELEPADEQNNSDDRIYLNNIIDLYDNRIYLNRIDHYIIRSNEQDEIMNFLRLMTFPNSNNEQYEIMNSENNHEEKNNEPKCTFCNSYYDHHNHSQYFMACCAEDYCLKCVKDFKETEKKECPKCHYSLKYLKDIELPTFDDVIPEEGEDCIICCYSMGTTQYNGKVTLECKCNLELCITCAYMCLKDTKHIKMENVQGLYGLVLPQEYIVKGSCPHCRQIPKNKDDIIALYNFLPPRY